MLLLISLLLWPQTVTDKQVYSRYEDVPPAYQHLFNASIQQSTYSLVFSREMACTVPYREFVTVLVDSQFDCAWKSPRRS